MSPCATLVAVACLAGIAVAQSAAAGGPTPRRLGPPAWRSFAEFLQSGVSDLVVVGQMRAAVETRHAYSESCGVRGLMPLPSTEIELAVEQVVFGTVDDSLLAITILEGTYGDHVGARVIVWAHRSSPDCWRLHGRLGLVNPDGFVVDNRGRPVFRKGKHGPVRLPELLATLDANRMHPVMAFTGPPVLALASVRSSAVLSDSTAAYELDSLGWVVGRGTEVPEYLVFPRPPGCYPDIFRGDSMLVPVPPGFRGRVLELGRCPSALRVQHGFVPGLGVRLASAAEALELENGTMRPRAMLRRP